MYFQVLCKNTYKWTRVFGHPSFCYIYEIAPKSIYVSWEREGNIIPFCHDFQTPSNELIYMPMHYILNLLQGVFLSWDLLKNDNFLELISAQIALPRSETEFCLFYDGWRGLRTKLAFNFEETFQHFLNQWILRGFIFHLLPCICFH